MTAPVRIEAEAWSDLRYATLARILGLADADHALIKVTRILSWQTEHYTPDAPTYVVDQDTIESALGAGGAAAMVRARLAEEVPEGYRITNAEGRIEWLWHRRQAAARGGAATRKKWKAAGEPEPSLMASKSTERNTSGPGGPPGGPPSGSATARPTPGALVPALVQISDLSLPPRAIDTPPYAIARETWAAVSAARLRVAAELDLANVIPLPASFGSPSEPRGCRDLRDRVREEGDAAAATCEHVIANLIAQAREERSVEWLSEKAFTAGGWQTARNWVPGQAATSRRRAGPRRADAVAIGAADPRSDHPEATTLKPFSEL